MRSLDTINYSEAEDLAYFVYTYLPDNQALSPNNNTHYLYEKDSVRY